VIEALLTTVGPDGTVMAPAFNLANSQSALEPQVLVEAELAPFDPEGITSTRVGAHAERIVRHPSARRSSHPALSFVAIGRNAQWLTSESPFDYPLGENSPIARLYSLNGGILLLGVGHAANVSIHLAEAWADAPYARRAGMVRIGETEWRSMAGNPECSAGFAKIEPILRQARILTSGYVGNAPSQYMRIRHVVSMAISMLRGDLESLLCGDPSCAACALARRFTAPRESLHTPSHSRDV
jgi:aminoglycoside 3-N-acetyltransferase